MSGGVSQTSGGGSLIGKIFGVVDRAFERLIYGKPEQSEQWDRAVRGLMEAITAEEKAVKEKRIKIERHTGLEKDSDLMIFCQPTYDEEASCYKFEGVKTTIIQEIVRDQETDEVIEHRWNMSCVFTDRLDISAEPRAEVFKGHEALKRWVEEDRRFKKRQNIRVIRVNRGEKK
jgi:hypothetical protein